MSISNLKFEMLFSSSPNHYILVSAINNPKALHGILVS